MNRAAYLESVDQNVDTTGNKGTTGQKLIDLYKSLAQNVPFLDELGSTRFTVHNPLTNYIKDDVAIYNGQVYLALEATVGAFDPLKWEKLPALEFLFTFAEWNEGNPYVIGNEVRYRFKVYRAIAASTGEIPSESPLSWQLVNVNNGKWGNSWQAGYFIAGDVLRYRDAFWIVPATYKSASFDDDIASGAIEEITFREFRKTYQVSAGDFLSETNEATMNLDDLPAWAVISEIISYNKVHFSGAAITSAQLTADYLGVTVLSADVKTTEDNVGAFGRPNSGVFPAIDTSPLTLKVTVGAGEQVNNLEAAGEIYITVYFKILEWHAL